MRRKAIKKNDSKRSAGRTLASVLLAGALTGCGGKTHLLSESDSGPDAIMVDSGPDSDRIRDSGHESGIDADIVYDSGRDAEADAGPTICAPPESCAIDLPTIVTLGEGESVTIRGRTTEILSIEEDVSEPSFPPGGGPGVCSITNEQVTLRLIDIDGTPIGSATLAQGACYVNGCISIEVIEIMEDVGSSYEGPCPISNELVRLTVTVPRP